MKPSIILIPLLLTLSACQSVPKDAYIQHAELNTPWGSTKLDNVATGKAAINLTTEERKALLTK